MSRPTRQKICRITCHVRTSYLRGFMPTCIIFTTRWNSSRNHYANQSLEKQGGPCNRDDLLNHRYVRIQERNIRRSISELDENDDVSVRLWVESHLSHVFFYEDFTDTDPFLLGIQTEWQLQQMIRFGNGSLLALDSRFGTNKLRCPIQSLFVFNSENKAIPVAWIIQPSFSRSTDTHKWMRTLYNRVRTKDPTWKLAGFIVTPQFLNTRQLNANQS